MYSMIISLNLYNKYFKSIILLLLLIPRIKRFELLMIDLKSIVLPLNYILILKLTGIEPILVPYQNTILTNWIIVSIIIYIYIYIYGVNENWTHIYCMQHNCSTNLTITPYLYYIYVFNRNWTYVFSLTVRCFNH